MDSSKTEDNICYTPTLLTFKVENTLFRAPRRRFLESQVFQDMFCCPTGQGTVEEGHDDAHPIVLDGIKAADFKAFLNALYPEVYENKHEPTVAERASALSLATIWSFERLREEIELKAMELSPCQYLELSGIHSFKDKQTIKDMLWNLACRPQRLTWEEARQIGFHYHFRVAELRERTRDILLQVARGTPSNTYTCTFHGDQLKGVYDSINSIMTEKRNPKCLSSAIRDDPKRGTVIQTCTMGPLDELDTLKNADPESTKLPLDLYTLSKTRKERA